MGAVSFRLRDDVSARLQELAEQRLSDHHAGKMQALSLEEVMKRYGLAG